MCTNCPCLKLYTMKTPKVQTSEARWEPTPWPTPWLSDSLTSDAEQWHNAGWDWCSQTNRVTSLNNFKNLISDARNNPSLSASLLRCSRARGWEESSGGEGSSWCGWDTEQSRSLPHSLRGDTDRPNSQSPAPLCAGGGTRCSADQSLACMRTGEGTRAPARESDAQVTVFCFLKYLYRFYIIICFFLFLVFVSSQCALYD